MSLYGGERIEGGSPHSSSWCSFGPRRVYLAHDGSSRRSACCQSCSGATLKRAFRRIDLASGWRSFEERVLLESMPSSNESSEASVNQQPVIPPPLLDDNTRRAELAARLRANWWGIAYNERILDSFVRSKLAIERHIEAALVADGYSPQVVFERRHQIRGFLFYPEGHALREDTYAGYLTKIANFGTRQSVPYQRVIRAVHNSHLFLVTKWNGPRLRPKAVNDCQTQQAGRASGSGEGDDNDKKSNHLKRVLSSACRTNAISSLRELIIEIYAESGEIRNHAIKIEHSNRWNWAVKTIFEEKYGPLTSTFCDIERISRVMGELASKGP